ncbi:T9SS type A sorting domain-containing protein [Adhaeribacter swui]|uniref:T9SS type A sorting domain-containing protein n=1 Tax=Adhaeribacter swui TaxID=2086471 RepID=A0A7G7GE82_9BACT|nr:T9SS type A sorting domain-containing protein [Adhaeribacter swui]QNF35466.1 T9SS type A sorting domain-containing protein [Adhaeribacter swui]
MKKIFTRASLIILASFHFANTGFAQDGLSKVWDKTYGGSKADILQIHLPTKDGGFILGGTSDSPVSGNKSVDVKGKQDFWIIKLDAAGNKQWDKTLGGSGSDYLQAIQQTNDGGYILGGSSDSPVSGDRTAAAAGKQDFWVVKLDATGNKTWDKAYGGNSNDYLKSVVQTKEGGYILGGISESPVSGKTGFNKTAASKGEHDYWLVKIDVNGAKTWDKTIGGSSFDYLQTVQQTTDGGYILGGHSFSPAGGNKSAASKGYGDFWIVKTDAAGNVQWDKTLGGNLDEIFTSMVLTNDGGYLAGGVSKSAVGGDKSAASKGFGDYWIVKLDAAGAKKWDKTIGGTNNDYLQSVISTVDGGYLLGGTSSSPISGDKTTDTNGNADYWIVKVDANGAKKWDKTFGGAGYDNLQSIQQTSTGAYILAGTSNSATGTQKLAVAKGETDFWIINTAVNGTEQPPVVEKPVVDQKVESFTLVNADTDQDLFTLTDGTTLNLATLPTRNLNIRANTSTNTVDSVSFRLSGAENKNYAEATAPFVLFGTVGNDYNAWTPTVGTYQLQGNIYSAAMDSDTVGTSLTIAFTVTDQTDSTKTQNPVVNQNPVANAGTDITITQPTSTVALNGSATDVNGTITGYTWSQVSGPTTASFNSKTIAQPIVGGLTAGTYVFNLVATNNLNLTSAGDQVTVTVNTAPSLPVANAGADITITLPTNSVTLTGSATDAKATISGYTWSQVSGPSTASFSSKTTAKPVVSNLTAGTYVFSLVATNSQKAVSLADQVTIVVNNKVTTNSQLVFTLVNADTDKDILTLKDGATLNLATLPTKNLNIRVNADAATVKSIKLALSGKWTVNKTETAPYTLFGDEKKSDGSINYGGVVFSLGDYTLKASPYSGTNASGTAGTSATIKFKVINQAASKVASANATLQTATAVSLSNYPNPFQGQTTIQFTSAQSQDYKLEVYDLSGNLVKTLKTAKAVAGENVQVTWNASQNKEGIYIIRLTTKNDVQHLRVILGK